MFIVIPTITKETKLYAIYSVVLSLNFIYSFADLGFVRATYKEAGECFGRNDLEGELRVIGFTTFLRLMLVIILTIPLFIFLLYPNIIIRDSLNNYELQLFRRLFIILIIFTPINSFMLISDVIYSTRIENYKLQKILVLVNIIKLICFICLFSDNNYKIAEYYLLINLLNSLGYLSSLYLLKKEYNISIKEILFFLKFDSALYDKLSGFSFAYFLGTLISIIYTQLDNILISKLFGLKDVAVFSISITLFNYLNNILSILYSPYASKFSYYVGKKDYNSIKILLNNLIALFSPLIILFICNVIFYIDCFTINWVGIDFINSIKITRILLIYYMIYGIQMPLGIYFVSMGLLRFVNILSLSNLITYFLGLFLLYNYFGIMIIPFLKVFNYYFLTIGYLIYLRNMLVFDIKKIFYNITYIIVVLTITFLLSNILKKCILLEKSKFNLLITIIISGFNILLSVIIYLFIDKNYKDFILSFIPQKFLFWRKKI